MAEIGTFINGLTEDTTPDTANDLVMTYDASASGVKKVKLTNIASSGVGADGWAAADAMTYAAADAPAFTMTCTGDQSAKYYAGMRIKLTQSTGGTKFFIVTKVAYTSSTTLTIYGGTDYTLNNEAITSPFYSSAKAPAAFPLDPTKWTVKVTDTTQRTQASPVNGTWYNLGTLTISIPIGVWEVDYQAQVHSNRAAAGYCPVFATLSTGNSTESDAEMTGNFNPNNVTSCQAMLCRSRTLVLAAKTAYYLNEKVDVVSMGNLYLRSDVITTVIRAKCAYL